MKTVDKLVNGIMSYWENATNKSFKTDYRVNTLIDTFLSEGSGKNC